MQPTKPISFSERVVQLALLIPAGHVTTYGRIAKAAGGGTMASRSITGILGKAYMAGEKRIPFHRIVYTNGTVWLDSEYEVKRRALYKKEGIEIDSKGKIKDFYDILFEFT
jgi:alkylated DNA nucleotide flippase Atl1